MQPSPHASHFLHHLAPGVTVIERGWLNCNHVLLTSPTGNVLIDSGYGRRANTTLSIVESALPGSTLHRLINTHCHSDHMGGNRALREKYRCRITIPAGEVKHVVPWTVQSCWAEEMDQYAEQFDFDDTIVDGDTFNAGGLIWEAIAAPGHDMDALMFWCASKRILISGDALWERGMGFVWPSREGNAPNSNIRAAFQTFDVIAALMPATVIPGHGAPFHDVTSSLEFNRSKLSALANDPEKAARNVAKSLFVFALLDKEWMPASEMAAYVASVPTYRKLDEEFLHIGVEELAILMQRELLAGGAVVMNDGLLSATMRV
jgi:glyoxylase-like metal-dependent hydrolase (beta-lactamase superfamily II)